MTRKRSAKTTGDFQCEQCEKSFTDARYLRKHVVRMHENAKEEDPVGKLTCGICGKQFPRLSHLTRHQVVHFNVRDWCCPFCSLSFIQKAHLVTHIGRKHREEKVADIEAEMERVRGRDEDVSLGPSTDPSLPSSSKASSSHPPLSSQLHIPVIVCAFCSATFSTNNQLKRHRETNHVVRRCPKCGESVSGRVAMMKHVKERHAPPFSSSSSIKSFLCLHCTQHFKQRTQLDRHFLARHFAASRCEYCREELNTPIQRRDHARDEHEELRCGYCNQKWPSEEALVKHVGMVHWRREYEGTRQRRKKAKVEVIEEKRDEREKEDKRDDERDKSDQEGAHDDNDDDDNDAEEEEEAEEKMITVSLMLLLPRRKNPDDEESQTFHVGAKLPEAIMKLYPEVQSIRVVLPPSLSTAHSLLVALPLPYSESIEEWSGKTIEVDLRDPEDDEVDR